MTTSIVFYRSVDLVNSVSKRIAVSQLIKKKDRILLSLSGGQDSICLLFVLNQMSDQMELHLAFFWCHHLWQIDSFFLMKQIAKLSFLFQLDSCFAIPSDFIPSELLARNWRYNCSYRVSLFYKYSKIGIAHSANDKIETVFLNLIRGTGLTGLSPLRWTQVFLKKPLVNNNLQDHVSQISPTLVSPFFWLFLTNSSNIYHISQTTSIPSALQAQLYIPLQIRTPLTTSKAFSTPFLKRLTTSMLRNTLGGKSVKGDKVLGAFEVVRGYSQTALQPEGVCCTEGNAEGTWGIASHTPPASQTTQLTLHTPYPHTGLRSRGVSVNGGYVISRDTSTFFINPVNKILIKIDRNQIVFLFICCKSKGNEIIQKFSSIIVKQPLFPDLYLFSRFFFFKTNFSLIVKRIVLKKFSLHTTKIPKMHFWTKKKIKAKKWFSCVSYTFLKTCSYSTTNCITEQ